MRIVYRDINTNELKSARYFEFDSTMNHTIVVIKDGTHLTLSQWQIVRRINN